MSSSHRIRRLVLLLLFSSAGVLAQARHWVEIIDNEYQIKSPTAEIALEIEVEDGYHIQSHLPESPLLIPTELTFQWPKGFENDSLIFPPTEPLALPGTESSLQVYSGTIRVRMLLNVMTETESGEYKIPGTLKYQACDDKKCYFPRELKFTLRITVY